ncbi:retinoid-inducible serine carboxypeptidase-like [Phlebotomus papatasi]|uniref:retinoid-inducible serine carboxypeptidase-like n=1 Tax=Phlebotomus papatasi TaxID=29031 RepID=UPI002483CEFB|nr:retinoid-inducible serine carboxypeptidase-like [Phlebotomus papatasi]
MISNFHVLLFLGLSVRAFAVLPSLRDSDWGFVTVRPGAQMFYWLFTTRAEVRNPQERPLIVWLQGGPGASSTGHGNFEEIGPLDVDLMSRNSTWVRDYNVLFIDSPVGSGFSHVEHTNLLPTGKNQITADLVTFLEHFFEKHPRLLTAPLHIFGESYGGKAAVELALSLTRQISRKGMKILPESVVLIDPWISPLDSMLSWAPFLFNTGAIDRKGFAAIVGATMRTQEAVKRRDYRRGTKLWGETEKTIQKFTYGVDFYNILKPIPFKSIRKNRFGVQYEEDEARIHDLMNGQVRRALNIPKKIIWGSQRQAVFAALSGDFLKPATDAVERLLNKTDVNVAVVNGQLDLIVATPGTLRWVERLHWPGKQNFLSSERKAIVVNEIHEGYARKYSSLSFYWVLRAGHMIPKDNPGAMSHILRSVTSFP